MRKPRSRLGRGERRLEQRGLGFQRLFCRVEENLVAETVSLRDDCVLKSIDVSMLTETGPRMCVEKGPLRRGLEGWSNDIRDWSELGPLRHEELAPLVS
jgi:hypothetical protein